MTTWDEAASQLNRPSTLSPEVHDVLMRYYTRNDHEYDGTRLRVGADLKPDGEGCQRATVYRLRGVPQDPWDLGTRIRLKGGVEKEQDVVAAFAHSDYKVETQVACWPMRPSFWAFAPGHADLLLTDRKHLIEVKAPRAWLFEQAKRDPKILVKTAYAWQLSFYFHHLRSQGRAKTAAFLFIDREGSHQPVEIPFTPDMEIPLDQIVALEVERTHLVGAKELPGRPPYSLEIKVQKGRKKNPPQRVVKARELRHWACGYCQYAETCQPGPEERECEVASLPEAIVRDAKAEAEALWQIKPKALFKKRIGLTSVDDDRSVVSDEDEQAPDTVSVAEAGGALEPRPPASPASTPETLQDVLAIVTPLEVPRGEAPMLETQAGTAVVPPASSADSAAVPAVPHAPCCSRSYWHCRACGLDAERWPGNARSRALRDGSWLCPQCYEARRYDVAGEDGLPEDQDFEVPDVIESYEILAAVFYRETRFMAPGKSMPLEMLTSRTTDEIRQAEWVKWKASREVRAVNEQQVQATVPQESITAPVPAAVAPKPKRQPPRRCVVCGKTRPTVRLASGKWLHAGCDLTPELAAELRATPEHRHAYAHEGQTCRCGAVDQKRVVVTSETIAAPRSADFVEVRDGKIVPLDENYDVASEAMRSLPSPGEEGGW